MNLPLGNKIMKSSYTIGVDIGGTNTDAVLVNCDDEIICAVKTVTTDDISQGFFTVLSQILLKSSIQPDEVTGIFLGTTHATNAILQKQGLFRVGVIRIAGQRPEALPVAFNWPKNLRETVVAGSETISGGLECHGGVLAPFRREEAYRAIKSLIERGVDSLAIVGVFSPLSGEQEKEVANILRETVGGQFPVSLSHEIGGIGFIERENSTILNAALKKVMQQGFRSLEMICDRMGFICPLMISQNDGSLIELERAMQYPVLTISAGPTNSFIGGARLAKLENAIVIDIGGTSTDIGLIRHGFPMRSLNKSNIGGVSLNFPMPDVLSIGLGGGSEVNFNGKNPKIGPQSVGKYLSHRALSFGGDVLTLTDVALAMKYVEIPETNPSFVTVDLKQGEAVFSEIKGKIEEMIVRIQGEFKDLPIIIVGGAAGLLPDHFLPRNYQIPPHYDVANAYGAALAEISGTVDTVVSLQNREEVLEKLYASAREKAIAQGANEATLKRVDQQIIPYSYIPNQMARVLVRFCGKRMKRNRLPVA
jgi:N-methylhydantoinase A/oxoprolinase/acetone carboxylase beta subunit